MHKCVFCSFHSFNRPLNSLNESVAREFSRCKMGADINKFLFIYIYTEFNICVLYLVTKFQYLLYPCLKSISTKCTDFGPTVTSRRASVYVLSLKLNEFYKKISKIYNRFNSVLSSISIYEQEQPLRLLALS